MGRPAEAAKCYKKNIAGKILSEGESFVVRIPQDYISFVIKL